MTFKFIASDVSPLDMLALSSENERMKIALAECKKECDRHEATAAAYKHKVSCLNMELARLKQTTESLQKSIDEEQDRSRQCTFSPETVDSDTQIKGLLSYYMGFNFKEFLKILNFLVPKKLNLKSRLH